MNKHGRRLEHNEQALGACLEKRRVHVGELHCFDWVESTMDSAFSLLQPRDRTVVVAGEQKKGRGRLGRAWSSIPGGLYASVVLVEHDPDIPYSMLASQAVLRAVHEHGVDARLKWVNDVLSGGNRKIAGVLTEERGERCVIGMGVNVNNRDFPPDLREVATSLYLESGKEANIIHCLCSILEHLFPMIECAHNGDIDVLLAGWEREAGLKGRRVKLTLEREELHGTVRGINRTNGALLLMVNGELREVYEGSLFFLD